MGKSDLVYRLRNIKSLAHFMTYHVVPYYFILVKVKFHTNKFMSYSPDRMVQTYLWYGPFDMEDVIWPISYVSSICLLSLDRFMLVVIIAVLTRSSSPSFVQL